MCKRYMKRLHICTNCYKQTCSKAVTPRGWKPRRTIKDGATAAETQTKQETLHQLETETRNSPPDHLSDKRRRVADALPVADSYMLVLPASTTPPHQPSSASAQVEQGARQEMQLM